LFGDLKEKTVVIDGKETKVKEIDYSKFGDKPK